METLKLMNIFVLSSLVACPSIFSQGKKLDKTRPNIILIYADDMGRGMLSTYGQKYFTTPHIDKLAEEGMRFSRCYGCQYSAPARASLITGMHDCHYNIWTLTRGGCYIKSISEINLEEIAAKIHAKSKPAKHGEVFLGTVAKRAGYTTAEFGKLEWGFATTAERIRSHGWDYHFGYYDHARCHGFYPPFLFENGKIVEIPGNTHVNAGKAPYPESPENYKKRWDMTGKQQYSEYIIRDKMLNFLEENNPKKTNKPLFIYYPTQLPHGPIQVPAIDPELFSKKELTSYEMEYATMIKILDNTVGAIYSKLEELDILNNTIIIFTGDNGHEVYAVQKGRTETGRKNLQGVRFNNVDEKYYSEVNGDIFDGNDGMAGLKLSNWEGGVRVPLIWYWKGKIKAGAKNDMLVANYDILNTIAELTGGKQVEGKDSRSYANSLLGKKYKERDYTVFSSTMGPAIVTKEGWKLRYHLGADVFQLYYLPDDYREEKVLNDRNPQMVEKLKAILLKECDDDFKNGRVPI